MHDCQHFVSLSDGHFEQAEYDWSLRMFPSTVCDKLQRAAECILKAADVHESGSFVRTHDLQKLCDRLPGGYPIKTMNSDLGAPTKMHERGGYDEKTTFTLDDALESFNTAGIIRESVMKDLEKRGGCA